MANYVTSTSDKSKTTALILCIFLGFVGAVNGKYFSRKKGIYFSRNAANYFPEFAAFYFPEFMLFYIKPAGV